MQDVIALPAWQEWQAGAEAERWRLAQFEIA
jgi:hypothetical protein